MTAEESSTSSAAIIDQSDWTKKLKYIELDDLEPVTTLTECNCCQHVSLVQVDNHPNTFFALKIVNKVMDMLEGEMMFLEKTISGKVRSDFIVKIYKYFEENDRMYLLMEYLPGRELWDLLPVSESSAKFYIACVVEALDHLHKQNIVHNDVKSSNIMLDADGYAKLIDFGLAVQLEENQKSYNNYSGTSQYVSPEVALSVLDGDFEDEGRDRACDLWALGVLLYELLEGFTPFDPDDLDDTEESKEIILENVTEGIDSIQFPEEIFSAEAEDLIRKLCTYDPNSRLGYETMDEVKKHRWFDGFDWRKLQERKLTPPMLPANTSVALCESKTYRGVSDSDSDEEDTMRRLNRHTI